VPRILDTCPKCSAATGPLYLATKVHSLMNSIPSKVLTVSGPSDLSVGSDSPEVPGPYNDISPG